MFNGIIQFSFPSPTLHKVTPYLDVLPFNSALLMICLSTSLPTHLLFTLSSIATIVVPHHLLMCTKQLSMNSMQLSLQLKRTCDTWGNGCISQGVSKGDVCVP
jgi:hypothetical protein